MSNDAQDFAAPTFHGARFENEAGAERPSLPVDVLPDLAIYEKLIVLVAGELYKAETGRKKVPDYFEDELQLRLRDIKPGSRQAVLKTDYQGPNAGLFVRARERVEYAIDEVVQGRDPKLPPNVIKMFGNFGKGLRGGEFIEVKAPNGARGPAYNSEVRTQFERLASREVVLQVGLEGTVVGAENQPRRLFKLLTKEHGLIKVPFPAHLSQVIADAWRDFKFVRVSVDGHLVFRKGKPQEFVEPPVVTVSSSLPEETMRSIEQDLQELATLKPGWADGEGKSLSKGGLGWLRGVLLEAMANHQLPAPLLSPMPEGGITASWKAPPWYVTAEFDLSAHTAFLHAAQVEADQVEVLEVDFGGKNEEEPLRRLAAFVRSYIFPKELA